MKNAGSMLLKLSAVVTMLITNAAFGWQLGIANYTSAPATLTVTYLWSSCRSDTITVMPNQIRHIDAGGCLVNDITGFVLVNGKRVDLKKGGYGTIVGRDFSVDVKEIHFYNNPNYEYRIERVM